MSKLCKKCKENIPNGIWIDKKYHSFQNRNYCLNCSPFKSHNTKKLEEIDNNKRDNIVCTICQKPLSNNQKNGKKCWHCCFKNRVEKRINKVYNIVGNKCYYCGYDRGSLGRKMLDFHHVDPSKKSFGLSGRELTNLSWDSIINEIKKCVLLCCRCHREFHAGLISTEEIEKIYRLQWEGIKIP